jgi:transposase/uncharacterized coiled-coil protein SlyX
VAKEPAYEQLAVLLAEQAEVLAGQVALIAEQTATIARLEERVAELQRQLGRNSRNSSAPPSKDPLDAPPRGQRKGSGRKPGKQPGAPGSALRLVEDPDEVVHHEPACCAGCGAGLGAADDAGVIRRQVHDIPEVTTRVVEHRLHRRACACGTTTTATGPDGLPAAPASYGSNLRALAVYLVVFQHVPVERAAQCIADVTGAHVSTGWVTSVVTATAAELADTEATIKALIIASALLHVDETSTNVAGRKCWLHVACTDALTAYYRHESRGRVAVNAFGVLPNFHGTLVHDALSVYDVSAYPDMFHALCGAHIARELTAAIEAHPEQAWPGVASDALHGLNTAAHTARDAGLDTIPAEVADPLLKAWRHPILVGLATEPRRPGRKQTKTRNLLERLHERDEEVLRFARDLTVPFTNNLAERDLRPTKTQLKISGSHRSATGAENWLRIRGYISTMRKNGINVMTGLRDAINSKPWTPDFATS